jgi:hypothetical protein
VSSSFNPPRAEAKLKISREIVPGEFVNVAGVIMLAISVRTSGEYRHVRWLMFYGDAAGWRITREIVYTPR